MQHLDFSPYYRSTIGFDRLFRLLDQATGNEDAGGYPPYNIEQLSENGYRITMAVAGFSRDEIDVELKESTLTVKAQKSEKTDEKKGEFLHRGIATRSFERRFQLADHVEVVGADLKDGLLHVELERNLPERMKPRTITISDGSKEGHPKRLEEVAV